MDGYRYGKDHSFFLIAVFIVLARRLLPLYVNRDKRWLGTAANNFYFVTN